MYSKFGEIEAACHLFDQMPQRNESSWNTMVSAFVRVGLYPDAMRLFGEMQTRGFFANGFVIASVLTACSRSVDAVHQGFQIHGLVLKNGLLCDVFVGTALLHFYSVYGSFCRVHKVFEEMPKRNVVSWTSLMVACLDYGDATEVIHMYQTMTRQAVLCNQNTFTSVISSCGSLEDEYLGCQVLGNIIKSGFEADISVLNSLISMFGNFGSMREACHIFHRMGERDTISWNSMISAYAHNWLCEDSLRCFCSMRCAHADVNSTTVSTLLSVCGSVDNVKWGRGIQGFVHKLGLDSDVWVCNTLLTMYSNTGKYREMEELFEEMRERDIVSWNSLMAGYVQEGGCLDALDVLVEVLHRVGKIGNHVTFASALAACSDPEFLAEGKAVHALALVAGFHGNVIVENALVTMYAKCGVMSNAKKLFEKMPERNLVSWNTLMGGYAEINEPDQALRTYMWMKKEGDEPENYITLVHLLGACASPDHLLMHGMAVHAHAVVVGFTSDDYVKNSLITMYAKCHDLNSSSYIFNGELVYKSSVTWNAMVSANAHHGPGEAALKLFLEMERAGVKLDQFSLSAALAAAANLAFLAEGQQLHCLAIKLGFDSYLSVTNAIMDMYGKCGEVSYLIKTLPDPNAGPQSSWNVLMAGLARHGFFKEALEVFHEMVNQGSKPDHVTFVALLSACSHGGMVGEGLSFFSKMTAEFGVPAGIEHCVCVIDLLGRAGRLEEAEAFIKKMPVPPNDYVWRSLLAACGVHGNTRLGKVAVRHLLELDPSDDSAYILYSNVCATVPCDSIPVDARVFLCFDCSLGDRPSSKIAMSRQTKL